MFELNFKFIFGMPEEVQDQFNQCVKIFNKHRNANAVKSRYYEGKIPLSEVNLGIALPDSLLGLEMDCGWGGQAVDVLAERSIFDGFVGENGGDVELITQIAKRNKLLSEYPKATTTELEFGCVFATLSADNNKKARIRFHSPETAAAKYNGELGRIECGLAIIDTIKSGDRELVSVINFYNSTSIWVLKRIADTQTFKAEEFPHKMGRPLMEPMIWNATDRKPLGRSRLKAPQRGLIKGFVRTICNATIGLEFATSPQKYLLGISDEQYDAIISQKFKQYVGSILAATRDPESGQVPEFGQLAQGNISPHIQMLKALATQFSAITGLSSNDVGVIEEANPTSSDAIEAQSKKLVSLAEKLNKGNGESLTQIMLMALAIEKNISIDELTEEDKAIMPHFKNPMMPSIASTADAALKIASARPGFGQTDVFLEMVGFSQSDIRRINAQQAKARGLQVLTELEE